MTDPRTRMFDINQLVENQKAIVGGIWKDSVGQTVNVNKKIEEALKDSWPTHSIHGDKLKELTKLEKLAIANKWDTKALGLDDFIGEVFENFPLKDSDKFLTKSMKGPIELFPEAGRPLISRACKLRFRIGQGGDLNVKSYTDSLVSFIEKDLEMLAKSHVDYKFYLFGMWIPLYAVWESNDEDRGGTMTSFCKGVIK